MQWRTITGVVSIIAITLAGCGDGSTTSPSPVATPPPTPTASTTFKIPAAEALSVGDVQTIIAQSVSEASARSMPGTIAVVDRVGNVLGVFRMAGAQMRLAVPDAPAGKASNADLQGVDLAMGAPVGAIAKAVTGAYLSSGGNAFSSRTASQIVQEHFPPAPISRGLESGPLFGVQFSSLPCSDLVQRFGANASLGPKRTPLGLSADAGGLPLYKNGVLVGGIGVMADGSYGFDTDILDIDSEDEEFIALAGTTGFEAPREIQADRITVDGTSLRFSDAQRAGLRATSVAGFSTFTPTIGALIDVSGYNAGNTIIAGTAYGSEASGIRQVKASEFSIADAFTLTDGAGNSRFPIRGGTDAARVAAPLTAAESRAILEEAFKIMARARGQIRRPLDSQAQVSISLVDTTGAVLGFVRSPDAPIFGIDVSLQKARTSAFFSNAYAAQRLIDTPNPAVGAHVAAARTFFNDPAVFTGKTAFPDRAIGNIARPYFPDGELRRAPGPLSRPIEQFSPFATGLQSTLIAGNVIAHALFVLGANPTDTPQRCTQVPDVTTGFNPLQNGIQIFPGSVPIYRGSVLIGAIGVSGDGIDQDDMISFLGVSNAGDRLGSFGNAPLDVRSDRITIGLADNRSVRLRYISCPFAPFLDTADQNVCQRR